MHAKTIVVPVDFSNYSQTALNHAAQLAAESGAKLHIVHVRDELDAYADLGFTGYAPPMSHEGELLAELKKVQPTVGSAEFEHKLLVGSPAAALVDYAKEVSADIIVMGTHGRKGLTRVLMGSVAEAVVRTASCPVLTVKLPASQPA
jgi:universal stress protein A